MMSPPKLALLASFLAVLGSPFAAGRDVSLNWLESAPPAAPVGVSFGVPWPRGTVQKDQAFALTGADGKALPAQSWILAYWPDGSIKWTGLATVAGAAGPFRLSPAAAGAKPA